MNALTIIEESTSVPAILAEEFELAQDFAAASRSKNTLIAYRSDLKQFASWCEARGLQAIPPKPETIASFLAAEASKGRKPSTISRRCAAIKWGIATAGVLADTEKCPTEHKLVTSTLAGIRRSVSTAPRQKKPCTNDIVISMVAARQDRTLRGLRDRCLLLMAFGGAFRASELTALDVGDIEFHESGLRVTIRRSKTSLEPVTIAIAAGAIACPAEALKAWLAASGIREGAVFTVIAGRRRQTVTSARLHHRNISLLVKARAAELGLDESDYSSHSMRAGWITSAAAKGASIFKLREVSRHKSVDVLSSYVRNQDLFRNHAGEGLL